MKFDYIDKTFERLRHAPEEYVITNVRPLVFHGISRYFIRAVSVFRLKAHHNNLKEMQRREQSSRFSRAIPKEIHNSMQYTKLIIIIKYHLVGDSGFSFFILLRFCLKTNSIQFEFQIPARNESKLFVLFS